jgi:uncharacterized membrane protein
MLLRKINAGLSLLSTFFLLEHAIFVSLFILSNGLIHNPIPFASWILTSLVAIHATISITLAIFAHKKGGKQTYKTYPKMNAATILQRVSGILLILLIVLHIVGVMGAFQVPEASDALLTSGATSDVGPSGPADATGAVQPLQILCLIVSSLFFALALAHTAVSVDKAFITLGIGNARAIKVISIVTKLVCAATLVASVVSACLYVC